MLFKYCSFQRAFEILTKQRIRFTQPSDFNDPFELHPEFQLMSKEDIADLPPERDERGNALKGMRQLTPEVLNRMLTALKPSLAQLQSIRQNHPGAVLSIDNNAVGRDYYDRTFGILSLTETPDSLLMWAHYADNHKGVVLGFDEAHPFFHGPEIVAGLPRLGKVEYNQKRPVLSPTTKDHPKVFLRKSTEWACERESRLFRPLGEAIETKAVGGQCPIHLFELPPDVIKLVVTGSQMRENEDKKLREFCMSNPALVHVSVHHARLSREHYALEIAPPLNEDERRRQSQGQALAAKPFDI